jgi:hypothetical protein
MRGWETVEGINQRWTGGRFAEHRLSGDEAAVYQELGKPDAIRFFRAMQTRQRVYEWIYFNTEQTVWFIEGARVDYVTVDANTSPITKEQRETIERKLITGGVVGAVVGGVGAAVLLFGESIGLNTGTQE